jgi:hypothetical protein
MAFKQVFIGFSLILAMLVFLYNIFIYYKEYKIISLHMFVSAVINVLIFLLPVISIIPGSEMLMNVIVVISFTWAYLCLVTRKKIDSLKVLIPVILLLILYVKGVIVAIDRERAIWYFMWQLRIISIGILAVYNIKDEFDIKEKYKTMVFSTILVIIPALYQVYVGDSNIGLHEVYNQNTRNLRLSGPFSDTLELAQFLGVNIALYLGMIYRYKNIAGKNIRKVFEVMVFALSVYLLIRTASRIVIIFLFAVAAVYFIFRTKIYQKLHILAISCGILLMLFGLSDRLLMSLDNNYAFERLLEVNQGTSVRLIFWKGAIQIFKDNPLGVGLGNYKTVVLNYMPQELVKFNFSSIPGMDERISTHAESTYLTLLCEAGITVVAIYLYILIKSILSMYKGFLRRDRFEYIYFGLALSWIVIIITWVSLSNVSIAHVQMQFWILFAMTSKLHQITKPSKHEINT